MQTAIAQHAYGLAGNKQTNPNTEKDGWNPLLWAACNGNEEIVRLLIKNNAHSTYIHK